MRDMLEFFKEVLAFGAMLVMFVFLLVATGMALYQGIGELICTK